MGQCTLKQCRILKTYKMWQVNGKLVLSWQLMHHVSVGTKWTADPGFPVSGADHLTVITLHFSRKKPWNLEKNWSFTENINTSLLAFGAFVSLSLANGINTFRSFYCRGVSSYCEQYFDSPIGNLLGKTRRIGNIIEAVHPKPEMNVDSMWSDYVKAFKTLP